MDQSLTEKLYLMTRMRAVNMPALPPLSQPVYWLHSDHEGGIASLLALSEQLLDADASASVVLTHPHGYEGAADVPRRALVALDGDDPAMARGLCAQISPMAVLIVTQSVPVGMVSVLGAQQVAIYLATMTPPVSGALMRNVLRHVTQVLLTDPATRAQWIAAGMPPNQLIPCGMFGAAPAALTCNEAERDDLAETFRHRVSWLAVGVPAQEEEMILEAHREALRDSHRLVLILHPADPQRGPALAEKASAQFNTALRSRDDPILPETQVYIADTQGERGLWYRLATACFIGGTATQGGARVSPYEAAALGCAVVHGRIFGAHERAFAPLINARATKQVLQPEALGRTICAAIRPDKAAEMAHQAWQVISEGAEANDIALHALQTAAGRA